LENEVSGFVEFFHLSIKPNVLFGLELSLLFVLHLPIWICQPLLVEKLGLSSAGLVLLVAMSVEQCATRGTPNGSDGILMLIITKNQMSGTSFLALDQHENSWFLDFAATHSWGCS